MDLPVVVQTDSGDLRPITEAELDSLRRQRGVRENAEFLLNELFPNFDAAIRVRLRNAGTTEELLRAQGQLKLLDEQIQYIKNKLKNQKGMA